MKKTTICLLLFAFSLTACNSGTDDDQTSDTAERSMNKPFSDPIQADTFRVSLSGKSPEEMVLTFRITSHRGKEIYKEQIKANELFKNYDATIDLKKKKNQVKFMNEELARFFDEENFMEPAITEEETPDQFVPDRAFYEELKASQLNGFIYRLGKENKVYIGWSEKEQKVKTYYSCCK